MTLGTRLVLGLGLVVAIVMGIYGANSLRQREALVADTLERETEALARALSAIAGDPAEDRGREALDPVLRRVLNEPDFTAVALVSEEGAVLSGGPTPLPPCLDSIAARQIVAVERVWRECDGSARLVVVAPHGTSTFLLVARGTGLIAQDLSAARRRILLTTIALAVLASFAILLVLRFALTRPLSRILEGFRATGGPLPPSPIRVPARHQAQELRELALAFNEMIERLEGKRKSLAREVEERIELDRRLRRSESFAALGRLTGGVAHELGSPLGVIGVRAEAIQADPEAGERARRHAAEISSEVARIASLVRDLIHVARRHGPGEDAVDIDAMVHDLVEEVRPRASAGGITLEYRCDGRDRPAVVEGDARLLRHAVYNVLLNALQALREHPGERRVSLSVTRAGEVVRIVIEDSGPGIATENFPHLFEPFFTTRDVGEGSGLGLSISAGIAEEHGGTLTIVPGKKGGVAAYFDLPALVSTAQG